MKFPWILSMSVGFLSLSQEILWMRYVGFAQESVPQAFSFVLAIFLLGIAAGALVGRFFCARVQKLYMVSAIVLFLASLLDMFGPIITALHGLYFLVPVFIFLCASLKSIIFPIVHHLGSSQTAGNVGKSVSRVYFMNILGATLGPLVTGFWLVDQVSLQVAMQWLALLTGLLGVVCALKDKNILLSVILLPCLIALGVTSLQTPDFVTSALACHQHDEQKKLTHIIETKSGIIHTMASQGNGGDYTYGGNVYDGRTSIDPRINSNILERIFVLAALRPEPENILVVGMSSGAWTRILTEFPGVKHIEVIEINPAYLQLIQNYPAISPFLRDPRVHVTIDDGRRWLRRHPDDRFDLIVMNTTLHQRAYSTSLLSQEFLNLVKSHLSSGGIVTYNTTWLPDVLKTAESVFPYAFLYINFVIASDHDFRPMIKTGREQLMRLQLDGKQVFDPSNNDDNHFIDAVLTTPFLTSKDQVQLLGREGEIITDWNMIPEYKYGLAHLPAPCN